MLVKQLNTGTFKLEENPISNSIFPSTLFADAVELPRVTEKDAGSYARSMLTPGHVQHSEMSVGTSANSGL